MTVNQFMSRCEQLIRKGWKATIGGETGKDILLRKPRGRIFCFDPMTAVYGVEIGKDCRNPSQMHRHLSIRDKKLGPVTGDIWAAIHGNTSDEGREIICRSFRKQIISSLGILPETA